MIKIIIGVLLILVLSFLFIKKSKNIKRVLQERIEKNAVKIPNISYTTKKGKEITEDIIIKHSSLPLVGDWGRIYPPLDEYGKVNWINTIFGGKKNFIKLLIILGIVAIVLLGYYELFSQLTYLKDSCVCSMKIIS
jgi:hypothetical protein